MTDISKFMGDPLIAAIDRVLLDDNANEKPRDYIGASSIGKDCSRAIWYALHGYKAAFTPNVLRAIADGHKTEELIISWLEKIPEIELHYKDGNGNQYGFSDLNGKYKGHYDGIIKGIPQSPHTWHVFEVKCVGEKYFKELQKLKDTHGEKEALRLWMPEYYAQAVTYMWYEKLSRHLTIIATPGGRKLMTVRTEQNHKYAKELKSKAQRILESPEPPEKIGKPDFYKCRMCGFAEVCHATT